MHFCSLLTVILCYLQFVLNAPTPCITPNSEEAVCVPLFSCSILKKALYTGNETLKEFVQASKCPNSIEVCCGSVGSYTNLTTEGPNKTPREKYFEAVTTKQSRREYVLKEVLPSSLYCGYQHSDDYHSEGNHTGIDEFPWLVHIEYRNPDLHPAKRSELKCVGVLLNSYLVLTSSVCATYSVVNIKIGQYHIHNSTSCSTSSRFGPECTDPTIETIGSGLAGPDGDLVVFVLSKAIQYSDYIRPICLPFEDSQRPKVGSTVYTSGWGGEDITGSTVHVKKRILHQIKSYNETNEKDEVYFGQADSTKYVCEGDRGGPLMYSPGRNQWFVAGLITQTPCNAAQPATARTLTAKTLENLIDPLFYFLLPKKS